MACNCKAGKDANKLIKTVEDINKSKSKDYISGNQFLKKTAFKSLSILIYLMFFTLLAIVIVPFISYMLITRKTFTIRPNKFFKNGK